MSVKIKNTYVLVFKQKKRQKHQAMHRSRELDKIVLLLFERFVEGLNFCRSVIRSFAHKKKIEVLGFTFTCLHTLRKLEYIG